MFIFFTTGALFAQDDLLNQLNNQSPTEKQIVPAAFKGLQICNMQSTKLPAQGEWYMVVSHRFGDLTNGLDNFFGLDNALTKIGGIYGATNWLSLGASRHTYNKLYELTAKYKFANQIEDGFPVTIVGYNTMDINSELKKAANPGIKFTNRLAYTSQLIVSRKFSESFSFEVAPIYLHKNLYEYGIDHKDQFFVGAGARYKLSKRLSLNLEYAARLEFVEGFVSPYQNPLSVGLDIETGGHVFQLVFSNSQPMNDVAVFSNTTGNWNGGSIYFGFNMYRVF
ncbi:hypothetical protein E0F76_10080 [Flavobacterium cellulosilyticum]|uniref:DUF5777 domain-containing protein n=2 Tax=Flavobacterium cellulosilyticum TaxID=2541731 RepID=A0A4R5CAY1_9FLAO|nr:hypothetical protein E0F76_10080 [Flavobacterium cellulosilyticum]